MSSQQRKSKHRHSAERSHKKNEALEKDTVEYKEKNEALEKDIVEYKKKNEALEKDTVEYKEKNEALEKDIVEYKKKNEALEKDIVEYKKQLENCEINLKVLLDKLTITNLGVFNLTSELNQLFAELTHYSTREHPWDEKHKEAGITQIKKHCEAIAKRLPELSNAASIIDEDQKTCTLITSSNIDHHKVREEIDEYLRYIEHEFPNSAESATKLWKHFNDTFQMTFDLLKEKVCKKLHQKLEDDIKEHKMSSDTMRAYGYLLSAAGMRENMPEELVKEVVEELDCMKQDQRSEGCQQGLAGQTSTNDKMLELIEKVIEKLRYIVCEDFQQGVAGQASATDMRPEELVIEKLCHIKQDLVSENCQQGVAGQMSATGMRENVLEELFEKVFEILHRIKKDLVSEDCQQGVAGQMSATGMREKMPEELIKEVVEILCHMKKDLVSEDCQQGVVGQTKKMIDIAWKMLTLNPPMVLYQPKQFQAKMHRCFNGARKQQSSDHNDLIYYFPVVVFANSGRVACKGFVGYLE